MPNHHEGESILIGGFQCKTSGSKGPIDRDDVVLYAPYVRPNHG